MKILAIDPGSKQSAVLCYHTDGLIVSMNGLMPNEDVLTVCRNENGIYDLLAVESIEGFGITAGQEIFDTCWWSGRFCQAFAERSGVFNFKRIGRKEIKAHLCGHTRAFGSQAFVLKRWPR